MFVTIHKSSKINFILFSSDYQAAPAEANTRHIPFYDKLDLIGAFDVMEHIEDEKAVLAQLSQACKTGGGIALTLPKHRGRNETVSNWQALFVQSVRKNVFDV